MQYSERMLPRVQGPRRGRKERKRREGRGERRGEVRGEEKGKRGRRVRGPGKYNRLLITQ